MTKRIPITTGFVQDVVGWLQLDEGITLDPELYRLEGGFEYDKKTDTWQLMEVSIVLKFDTERVK